MGVDMRLPPLFWQPRRAIELHQQSAASVESAIKREQEARTLAQELATPWSALALEKRIGSALAGTGLSAAVPAARPA